MQWYRLSVYSSDSQSVSDGRQPILFTIQSLIQNSIGQCITSRCRENNGFLSCNMAKVRDKMRLAQISTCQRHTINKDSFLKPALTLYFHCSVSISCPFACGHAHSHALDGLSNQTQDTVPFNIDALLQVTKWRGLSDNFKSMLTPKDCK